MKRTRRSRTGRGHGFALAALLGLPAGCDTQTASQPAGTVAAERIDLDVDGKQRSFVRRESGT